MERIRAGLFAAAKAAGECLGQSLKVEYKSNGDPVTDVERRINEVLRCLLPRDDEGWLSEETADDPSRLERDRVWVVDPIDGTREFVEGLPEWCISIGLVERGESVAGGVLNPSAHLMVLGAIGSGITVNGKRHELSKRARLSDCLVLASRSEVKRGEWEWCGGRGYEIRSMGSIAFKLCFVAAGLADVTWTLTHKHEWDVAAGVALVNAAGGEVYDLQGNAPKFNRSHALISSLIAHRPGLRPAVGREMASRPGPPLPTSAAGSKPATANAVISRKK